MPAPGSVSVVFSAAQAAAHLWDYGEDELVDRALALTDPELREIWGIAGKYWDPEFPLPGPGQRIVLDQVIAYAVITYVERRLRPLASGRRRRQKDRPDHLRHPQPVPPGTIQAK